MIKRLLIIVLLTAPAWGQITRVQSYSSISFSNSCCSGVFTNNTGGDSLVLFILGESFDNLGTLSGVTDTAGNTYVYGGDIDGYTTCTPGPSACVRLYVYYVLSCKPFTGSNTVTATFTVAEAMSITGIEYTPLLTDVSSTWAQANNASSLSSGSATTTATDVVLGFSVAEYQWAASGGCSGNPPTQSASPTWSVIANTCNTAGNWFDMAVFEKINAAAASYSNTFSIVGGGGAGSQRTMLAGLIAFKPAAGALRHRAYVTNH